MNNSLQQYNFLNSRTVGKTAELELPFGKNQSAVSFKIHYYDEGTGEPLVFVHSAGQSIYTWSKLLSPLSQHFRVIAVDLLGHGYSDSSPYCTYSVDEQARVLGMFLTKIGISSSHFVGYSVGCGVITAMYMQNPKRVSRVVLIAPGGITPLMPTPIRMMDSRFFSFLSSLLINPSSIRSMLEECFLDLTLIDETKASQYIEPIMLPDAKRALRCLAYSFDEEEVLEQLRSFDTPALILNSSDDRWRTLDMIQQYFKAIPEKYASSAVIRNAGHLMHEEQPEKVVNAIKTFIDPPKDDIETEGDTKETDVWNG